MKKILHIISFFTPPEKRTLQNLEALQHSDEEIREIMEADETAINRMVLPMVA
jgi:hypothetical protein